MPINLDFAGLNTLVREDIDPDKNQIGADNTSILLLPNSAGGLVGFNSIGRLGYGRKNNLSVAFWFETIQDKRYGPDSNDGWYYFRFLNSSNQVAYEYSDAQSPGSSITGSFIEVHWDEMKQPPNATVSNDINEYYLAPHNPSVDARGTQLIKSVYERNKTHIALVSDFNNREYKVYINGELANPSSIGLGDITDDIAIFGFPKGTFGTFDTSIPFQSNALEKFVLLNTSGFNQQLKKIGMHNFMTIDKVLSEAEVKELYSSGFKTNTENLTFRHSILDYFDFGAAFNKGELVPSGSIIHSVIGNNSVETSADGVATSTVFSKETRNQIFSTIPYANYFTALMENRNGPYGFSTFKQIRSSENPVTRHHRKNNVFSYIPKETTKREIIEDGKVISTHFDKYGRITNLDETPVTFNKKPLSSIVNVSLEEQFETVQQKLVLKSTYANDLSFFKNKILNSEFNKKSTDSESYRDFKSIYLNIDADESVIDNVESITFSQTIFPTDLYCSKHYTRQRPNFISGYWRTDRLDRTERDIANGFGHIVPSQSMWPLDAVQNFTRQSLANSLGTFIIVGTPHATASATIANAFGFHFPDESIGERGLVLAKRDFFVPQNVTQGQNAAGSIIHGVLTASIETAHLVTGSIAYWESIRDRFLNEYGYDNVTFTQNLISRKAIEFDNSVIGNEGHRYHEYPTLRYMQIQNILRDESAGGATGGGVSSETHRQHWFSASVNCSVIFWADKLKDITGLGTRVTASSPRFTQEFVEGNADHKAAIDTRGTILYDVSSSVSGGTLGEPSGSTTIDALRRHIYFEPPVYGNEERAGALFVRLGTKWTKNDGTTHFGNTPELGAVEFIFNVDKQGHSNTHGETSQNRFDFNEKAIYMNNFYISFNQSNQGTHRSTDCLLGYNGEFITASQVVDTFGFLTGTNPTKEVGGVGYTASSWTVAHTLAPPTNVFFFQAGNFPGTHTTSSAHINHALQNIRISDFAIFSGAVNNQSSLASLNEKIKHFTGGKTITQALTSGERGVRWADYTVAKASGSVTELSGPLIWFDFEKTHQGDVSSPMLPSDAVRNLGFQDSTYGKYNKYNFSASMDKGDGTNDNILVGSVHVQGFTNISQAVANSLGETFEVVNSTRGFKIDPLSFSPVEFCIDNGSTANFTLTPASQVNKYQIEISNSSGYSENGTLTHVSAFNSPSAQVFPIGGAGGFKSKGGSGILQNSYNTYVQGFNELISLPIDTELSAACLYNRKNTLLPAASFVNPFLKTLTERTLHPVEEHELYLGEALWEAPSGAGFFDSTGTFVSRPKEPFYDSYGNFAEEFRGLGKDYSIVPEFRISKHVEHYLTNGETAQKTDLFEISGALAGTEDSSNADFFKVYSNSEFLELFDIVKEDHKNVFDPFRIKLQCKAIKKFLPYKGFYPCQRTVQIAEQFYSSYHDGIETHSYSMSGSSHTGSNYPFQHLINPLFGPGILYNTIKAGIACDYPVITGRVPEAGQTGVENHEASYYYNRAFDERIPFEALLEPEKHLANKVLRTNEPDPNGSVPINISWNGQGDRTYSLQMNNFLAEVGSFFLKNESYTTIASLPQGDPNFGNAEGDKVYSMRLKMYRTISGSKSNATGSSNNKGYGVPQDTGSMGESFTMYSRPGAFGPPTVFSSSLFIPRTWETFKKANSADFHFSASQQFQHVTGNNALNGFNYPFTPPYYHGEAWADITFVPPDGTKKYTLAEVLNNSSIEFYRFWDDKREFGANEKSGSILINDQAMQIASSMNIFSKGVLKDDSAIDLTIENKYRWIMQSKFETPTLNFNHNNHTNITLPNFGSGSTPIGMWHQYGRVPQKTNEGIFIQVGDIPTNWIENAEGGTVNNTGSLVELCGFSTDPLRVGEIKQIKRIEEAVVAIPFVSNEGSNSFFNISREDVDRAINGDTENVGTTISRLVRQMRKYVFPPQFDFVKTETIQPFAMYVFEFSHDLNRQDLADIWQNLPPEIGITHETATAEVSHELFAQEFFGTGAVLEQDKMKRFTNLSEFPSDIRWMIFKVKKRATNNYFQKMFNRNESGADLTADEIASTAQGAKSDVAYNWPYDFFSLVELIKLDATVEFANVDQDKSIEKDQLFIKPFNVRE